jgi:hypothetical protein
VRRSAAFRTVVSKSPMEVKLPFTIMAYVA